MRHKHQWSIHIQTHGLRKGVMEMSTPRTIVRQSSWRMALSRWQHRGRTQRSMTALFLSDLNSQYRYAKTLGILLLLPTPIVLGVSYADRAERNAPVDRAAAGWQEIQAVREQRALLVRDRQGRQTEVGPLRQPSAPRRS